MEAISWGNFRKTSLPKRPNLPNFLHSLAIFRWRGCVATFPKAWSRCYFPEGTVTFARSILFAKWTRKSPESELFATSPCWRQPWPADVSDRGKTTQQRDVLPGARSVAFAMQLRRFPLLQASGPFPHTSGDDGPRPSRTFPVQRLRTRWHAIPACFAARSKTVKESPHRVRKAECLAQRGGKSFSSPFASPKIYAAWLHPSRISIVGGFFRLHFDSLK